MTDSNPPGTLSVIIPTYNRVNRLKRVLEAIAAQECAVPIEVIVVSDGSTDGTDEYLRSGTTPMPIHAVTQANAGPAAARNAGLAAATGSLVLFIDDDVVPEAGLISAHLRRHAEGKGDLVVIGPMLTPLDAKLRPWVAWEQAMLDKQYDRFETEEPDAHPRHFYTGNASAPRKSIVEVGGFDARFRRAEDVELAYRLQGAGLEFVFEPAARARHYADRSESSWSEAAYQYGRNDITFANEGQKDMLAALCFEFRERHAAQRWMVMHIVPHRWSSAVTRVLLSGLGRVTARLGLDGVSGQAYSGLFGLRYYRGVADELGSSDELVALLTDGRFEWFLAAFVLEQTLGHITHANNLHRILAKSIEPQIVFIPVEPVDGSSLISRVPVLSNWTLQAGLRARRGLRHVGRKAPWKVMFVHTQVPAVLLGKHMRRIPTIVSLDATPMQYDRLGEYYAHDTSAAWIERLKKGANLRCFRRAAHLVTWSSWARQSLIDDYGVDGDKVTVVPPGVDLGLWERVQPRASSSDGPVRLLFVGGDLPRKGGDLLIEATRRLRADADLPDVELHLVTKTAIAEEPGVHVHSGMTPNSPELIALYHSCDIFCLPTLGDCLPMVLSEAGAARMALVSTDVGAIHEVVRDGETGLLIPPGDVDALTKALHTLVADPDLRHRLSAGAHDLVRRDYDAIANAHKIVSMLLEVGRRPTTDD